MKKVYVRPLIEAIEIKPMSLLAGSTFGKDDFGGGGGDGGGAVVNSMDSEFADE